MLLSITADERAEAHFVDVASALDAGLPLAALGAEPGAGERAVHTAVERRGVRLRGAEELVLLHGWRAGKASAALRACAAARAQRVAFARLAWSGLRYPLLLAVMLLVASVATSALLGPWPAALLTTLYATIAVTAWLARRALRAGSDWPRFVPGAAGLLDGFSEIPYLESLRALYGAGVPLLQAHAAAVAATPPGRAARRLQIADGVLQKGSPLHEALATALALHAETRALLHTGEISGQLEDALGRALQRRRDVHGRALARAARFAGNVAYAAAAIGVLWMALSFYGAVFSQLRAGH